MRTLLNWLDDRTGYRDFVSDALYENIPGGSRWRYVWGSTLVFTFFVQVVTGIFLWMSYSPSTQTAWESVYYIDYHMGTGGQMLRGVHHYAAQLMVVLMVLHLVQVVIHGAYRAPREMNFWIGLILMQIVLGLALTGYLLPWDQKGYWATKVATEIAGSAGAEVPALVVGGSDYGHHTLTRFFALHAGVLPGLLVLFLVIHIALFRRHGVKTPQSDREAEFFWPGQVLKDAIACLVVLVAIVALAWYARAELGSPADAAESYSAARPEWYFLFLFQFLKYFKGETGKLLGAIVIPGVVMGYMFLMPLIGRARVGHLLNVAVLVLILVGAGVLTGVAWYSDNYATLVDESEFADAQQALEQIAIDLRKKGRESAYSGKTPEDQIKLYAGSDEKQLALLSSQLPMYKKFNQSRDFLAAVEEARVAAERVRELAVSVDPKSGETMPRIPPTGALALLRSDPQTQGPKLFRSYCASCHDHVDEEGNGIIMVRALQKDSDGKPVPTGGPNLYGFASRPWLRGLLDPERVAKVTHDEATWQVLDADYFGNTKHASTSDSMVDFVKSDLADLDDDQQKMLDGIIIALSAEAGLPSQAEADAAAEKDGTLQAGREAMVESFENYACVDCHKFRDDGDLGDATDLTGYGSRQWLIDFISNPSHSRFYGKGNDRMPAFDPTDPNGQLLSPEKIALIVDWLRDSR